MSRPGQPRRLGGSSAGTRTGRRLGRVGAGLLLLAALVAAFAPLLAAHDPSAPIGAPYQPPSLSFPLGTDDVGHDLFAHLVHGARISLTIGVASAVLATAIGLAVAVVAGYFRGRVEGPLMRLVDLTLAFPFFVLVIVLAAFFGRSLLITVAVISAVLWAKPARVLYADVVKVREFPHVVAARAMGASPLRVLGRHVVPRVAPLAVSQFVRTANVAVFLESALAFLGLGDPNNVSWGSMLFFANARSAFLTDAWLWWILPPGLALTAVLVGFAFLGYVIEEGADPRLSGRRALLRGPRRRTAARSAAREHVAPQAADTVLEVRELAVCYRSAAREVRAVDGVSLSVAPGSIVGLVGESGSGKSTLALALLGLLRPPAQVLGGQIMLDGRDLRTVRGPEARRIRGREIALVPQGAMSALNPVYPVQRQVAEAAALTRPDPQAAARRARELLEQVGIARDRHGAFPHELSGGMRQRVMIAMAVANEPRVIVADEPVTGLDVVTQARILRLLLELRERLGLAVILISHDLPLVARTADELLVMQSGRVVEAGAAGTVAAQPRHPHTRALLAATPGSGRQRAVRCASAAGPVTSASVLQLREVSRTFVGRRALRRGHEPVPAVAGVCVTVGAGETLALVGESGAGKSTVGRMVLGLESPDAGQVRFQGVDVARLRGRARRRVRRRMHLILQDPYESLHPGMRVGEAVGEPLAIAGMRRNERRAQVARALEDVGLSPAAEFLERFPHELSGGQRQRVAMARAFIARPELVVADEPTSMLDASLRSEVLRLMAGIRERLGTTFLLITHDLTAARAFADRVAVMQRGTIIEEGPTEKVLSAPAHEYTTVLLAASEGRAPEEET